MRLATALLNGTPSAHVIEGRNAIAVADLNDDFPNDTMSLIEEGVWRRATAAAEAAPHESWHSLDSLQLTAPYRRPRKIWGIGLNYQDHASDLDEEAPEQPASFIKADHTIAGPDEPVVIPEQSGRTTTEAELGLIIGRECRGASEEDALDYLWGVTTILDQTAEDILRVNPRFLTRAKNFPSFFVFGPELVPMEDVLDQVASLEELEVITVVNGDQRRSNTVANMTHSPATLISFHSQMMPLFPGDIISTGAPGAIVIGDGDTVEAVIPGVGHLRTTVRSQRAHPHQDPIF
jgi:2-keto-4-pentenoate hydratase/2-oxohepta-3-ene-1,7-dioic acid hydratase in catechol pathway